MTEQLEAHDNRVIEWLALVFYLYGVVAVRAKEIVALIMLFAAFLWGGCSDPPELAAAKKISESVAQARNLMKEASKVPAPRAQELLAQAQKLLQEALKTPDATVIAKQNAHELLGGLLSEITARDLAGEEFVGLQQSFAEADSQLHYSLSQLSLEAGNLAYAAGLGINDDQTLQQHRKELSDKIPQLVIVKDNAVKARMDLGRKLAQTKGQAYAARLAAESLFLEAETLTGDSHVSKTAEAANRQLEADLLWIKVHGEELALRVAKEEELGLVSELASLQQALERVEQQIGAHAAMVSQSTRAGLDAKAAVEKTANELLAQLASFYNEGTKLSEGYKRIIEQQGQAVGQYNQALVAAKGRSRDFRKYKSERETETALDERVEMFMPLAEVDLTLSLARAEIVRAGIQQELAGVLRSVSARAKQIEQIRKALSAINVVTSSSGLDIVGINEDIQQAQNAALDNLNSAVLALGSIALPGRNEEVSAEQIIKALERTQWNWQVWGMLGLTHQARATLQQQMGRDEQAQADTQTAATYLAKANEVRAGLIRSGG